jgi:hypothetical protein
VVYVTQGGAAARRRALFLDLSQGRVITHALGDVRGFVDDKSVLAGESDGKAARLFVYDFESRQRRPVAELPPDSPLDAVSPPRNDHTAYVKRSKQGNELLASLYYKALDGGEERRLCVDAGRDEVAGPVQNVELSPDGQRVLFTSYVPGKARELGYAYPVVVADVASNVCTRLDTSPLFNETTWLSNAEVLLRPASGHVRVLHVVDGRKFGPLQGGQLVRAF